MKIIITLVVLFSVLPSVSYSHDEGIASFYGAGEPLNTHTANGERFDPKQFTAASRHLKFNTMVQVCRSDSPEICVVVRINDRGPAEWTGRLIDLSHAAGKQLDMIEEGLVPVYVHVLNDEKDCD